MQTQASPSRTLLPPTPPQDPRQAEMRRRLLAEKAAYQRHVRARRGW